CAREYRGNYYLVYFDYW
nr:immunoglobulin heavy chain junction region [Macaca mulatta]